MKCDELHLDCTSAGSEAFSASALPGFARLGHPTRAFQCLPPELRCNATGHKADSGPTAVCLKGYSGPLCMDCAATYYATGSRCAPCLAEAAVGWSAWLVAVVVVAVAMVAAWWFSRRSATPTASLSLSTSPTSFSVFKELISAQGPMLLQMCQLWAVLAALSRSKTVDAGGESDADAGEFWEVPYVQALQLSVTNFKSALTLQCNYDGAAVRFALALAAPVIPLLLLLCCLVCEFWRHGLGINLGLSGHYFALHRWCAELFGPAQLSRDRRSRGRSPSWLRFPPSHAILLVQRRVASEKIRGLGRLRECPLLRPGDSLLLTLSLRKAAHRLAKQPDDWRRCSSLGRSTGVPLSGQRILSGSTGPLRRRERPPAPGRADGLRGGAAAGPRGAAPRGEGGSGTTIGRCISLRSLGFPGVGCERKRGASP